MSSNQEAVHNEVMFDNPFQMADLEVFDDQTLQRILTAESFGLTVPRLAHSLKESSPEQVQRVSRNLSRPQRSLFVHELEHSLSSGEIEDARRQVLDSLFWELTYWKTPGLYEQLTEGEQLHPGIFQQLEGDIRGKVVLDVGAGSGRATFECLRYGAGKVYAVEPSPGLLHMLQQKMAQQPGSQTIVALPGRFDALPLADDSVDVALSCSAFTTMPEQGGEPGLVELQRVTRDGGIVVLIWPRTEDRDWLQARGFHYVALPVQQEMQVRFRSLGSAIQCARRFYAHNGAVLHYLLTRKRAEVPFSVIGVNPPCDYCWLKVTKHERKMYDDNN